MNCIRHRVGVGLGLAGTYSTLARRKQGWGKTRTRSLRTRLRCQAHGAKNIEIGVGGLAEQRLSFPRRELPA